MIFPLHIFRHLFRCKKALSFGGRGLRRNMYIHIYVYFSLHYIYRYYVISSPSPGEKSPRCFSWDRCGKPPRSIGFQSRLTLRDTIESRNPATAGGGEKEYSTYWSHLLRKSRCQTWSCLCARGIFLCKIHATMFPFFEMVFFLYRLPDGLRVERLQRGDLGSP